MKTSNVLKTLVRVSLSFTLSFSFSPLATAATSTKKVIRVSPQIRSAKRAWSGINKTEYSIPYAGRANRTLNYYGLTRETRGKLITYFREEKDYSFVSGKISHFGGAKDDGVTIKETGALSGENLRKLDGNRDYYVAMRFNYGKRPRSGLKFWKQSRLLIVNPKNGRAVVARPIDWGPNPRTRRIVDASPATLKHLGVKTDDTVWVSFAENNYDTGPVQN